MIATRPFDAAVYLQDGDDQLDLLRDARASGDQAYLEHALEVVARANGLSRPSRSDQATSVRQAFRGQHGLMRQAA